MTVLTHRHINNVSYCRYLESARMRWVLSLVPDLGDVGEFMLVSTPWCNPDLHPEFIANNSLDNTPDSSSRSSLCDTASL